MFDEAEFQRALAQPRLSRPVPEFLESNRAVPIRAIPETELQATTQQCSSPSPPSSTISASGTAPT
jgi:hypothetical protein